MIKQCFFPVFHHWRHSHCVCVFTVCEDVVSLLKSTNKKFEVIKVQARGRQLAAPEPHVAILLFCCGSL